METLYSFQAPSLAFLPFLFVPHDGLPVGCKEEPGPGRSDSFVCYLT
jgi:hypothetical protein